MVNCSWKHLLCETIIAILLIGGLCSLLTSVAGAERPNLDVLSVNRATFAGADEVGICSYFREDGYRAFHSGRKSGVADTRWLLGGSELAYGISDNGRVAAGYYNGSDLSESFRWSRGGGNTGMGASFSPFSTSAACILADGAMAVGSTSLQSVRIGFVGDAMARGKANKGLGVEWGLSRRVAVGASMSSRYLDRPAERMITNFSVLFRF